MKILLSGKNGQVGWELQRSIAPLSEPVADVTAHAIRTALQRPEVTGLYHLVVSGQTSWHGYASPVIDFARQSGIEIKVAPEAIQPVPTNAFPLPAPRPKNSRLDTRKLQNTFGLNLPHWQNGITLMLSEIFETQS